MKNYKIIISLILLSLVFGCSGTSTYEEVDYTYPKVKSQPRLMYPKEAQENNYSGISKVYLDISNTGRVANVTLMKSSGFDVLDKAALDYCKKMVFAPATKNGKAIESHMAQEIKFTLLDKNFSYEEYISEIINLYRLEKKASGVERNQLQNEILQEYDEFLSKMGNTKGFNIVLEKIISPATCSEWENCWDHWPLSFLFYHDFLKRFPDYDSVQVVKNHLRKALDTDIEFILNTPTDNYKTEKAKMDLVKKIESFVKKNYPAMPVNYYNLNSEINS